MCVPSKVFFLFQIFSYNQMDWFCVVCDQTIATKSKGKHLQTLTYIEFENVYEQNTLLKIPNSSFNIIDSIFCEYNTSHNKKRNFS